MTGFPLLEGIARPAAADAQPVWREAVRRLGPWVLMLAAALFAVHESGVVSHGARLCAVAASVEADLQGEMSGQLATVRSTTDMRQWLSRWADGAARTSCVDSLRHLAGSAGRIREPPGHRLDAATEEEVRRLLHYLGWTSGVRTLLADADSVVAARAALRTAAGGLDASSANAAGAERRADDVRDAMAHLVAQKRRLADSAGAVAQSAERLETAVLLLAFSSVFGTAAVRVVRLIRSYRDANKQVEQVRDRLELATLGANDGLWDWLIAQKRLYWSPRTRALLGYGTDEAFSRYVVGANIHDEDIARARAAVRAHLGGQSERLDLTVRLRRYDGDFRWFRVRGIAQRDVRGHPERVLGTIADIHDLVTATETAEVALESAHRVARELELALDGADVALWAFDPTSGRILHHRGWERLLGRGTMPDDFSGWLALTHPHDLAQRLQKLNDHLDNRTGQYESEFRMRHADGQWVWVRSRGRATERDGEGRALQYAGAVMNIGAQVAARQLELREQSLMRTMIEGVGVGVMISGKDHVLYVNTAFCYLLGYDHPSELAGLPLERLLPPQQLATDRDERDHAERGGVVPMRVAEWLTRDGGRMHAVCTLSAVEWLGRPHFITTTSALEDHTALEAQLKTASEQFQRALVMELERQQENIARELHDSLGSILAGVSMLVATARATSSQPPVNAMLERSHGELTKAAEMTRTMARVLMPVGSAPGAFAPAVERFAEDFSRLSGVGCQVLISGSFVDVDAMTGTQVFRVIQEACTNAVRHGCASQIRVALTEDDDAYVVTVTDNGKGFDPRGVDSDAATGLGLRSMRARARSIGGALLIERMQPTGIRIGLTWAVARMRRDAWRDSVPG